ncbi:flagellar hook-basal body complex protein FliE [Kaarinaea lacus]
MKEIDTNNLLAQLRANAAVAQNQVPGLDAVNGQADGPSFSSLLQQSINKVNELQGTSAEMSKAFELGDPSVSLAEVMIAKQKSSIAFQSVLQVRNKLMEAYREVMSMQV